MKNKFSKLLATFMLLITIIASVPCIAHAESGFELIESSDGNTLVVHNEVPGKLDETLKNRYKFGTYEHIKVSGKMDKNDFLALVLVSFNCKSIDLYDVEIDSIPVGSFRQNLKLEKFILPKGIKTIETLAFADCDNLEIEKLPESLEFIGNYAFEYCEKLNITIPNKVKLGEGAFKYCPNVVFSEDDKTTDSNNNKPSKTIFSSIISYIGSWF